jgi:hypothetical protein
MSDQQTATVHLRPHVITHRVELCMESRGHALRGNAHDRRKALRLIRRVAREQYERVRRDTVGQIVGRYYVAQLARWYGPIEGLTTKGQS